MEYQDKISKQEFHAKYHRTDVHKDAIFGGRKTLMEEIYVTGAPIYCDQSYYAHYDTLDRVKRIGEHFECEMYKNFEEWRDCHYYTLYVDNDGNAAWLMHGGRYD